MDIKLNTSVYSQIETRLNKFNECVFYYSQHPPGLPDQFVATIKTYFDGQYTHGKGTRSDVF